MQVGNQDRSLKTQRWCFIFSGFCISLPGFEFYSCDLEHSKKGDCWYVLITKPSHLMHQLFLNRDQNRQMSILWQQNLLLMSILAHFVLKRLGGRSSWISIPSHYCYYQLVNGIHLWRVRLVLFGGKIFRTLLYGPCKNRVN